nr:HNH endonuclease family protein [Candidatus Microthrix sp.]
MLAAERHAGPPGLPGGGWLSEYEGYSTPDESELDIDHLVPLAEAWRSGASRWDPARRAAFANDLDAPQTLIAVTAATNRSKSDSDPSDWQPPNTSYWCTYASDWGREAPLGTDRRSGRGESADQHGRQVLTTNAGHEPRPVPDPTGQHRDRPGQSVTAETTWAGSSCPKDPPTGSLWSSAAIREITSFCDGITTTIWPPNPNAAKVSSGASGKNAALEVLPTAGLNEPPGVQLPQETRRPGSNFRVWLPG